MSGYSVGAPKVDEYVDIGDPLGLQRAFDAVKDEIAARDNQAAADEISAEVARALG